MILLKIRALRRLRVLLFLVRVCYLNAVVVVCLIVYLFLCLVVVLAVGGVVVVFRLLVVGCLLVGCCYDFGGSLVIVLFL